MDKRLCHPCAPGRMVESAVSGCVMMRQPKLYVPFTSAIGPCPVGDEMDSACVHWHRRCLKKK
eukprot:1631115-Pyramimonas_sp.AAC.2